MQKTIGPEQPVHHWNWIDYNKLKAWFNSIKSSFIEKARGAHVDKDFIVAARFNNTFLANGKLNGCGLWFPGSYEETDFS